MNQRIRQLAEQATELDYTTFDSYNHKTVEHYKFNKEKFAELIVKECIQVGGPEDSYTDEWFKAKADSVNKIREHFGVE